MIGVYQIISIVLSVLVLLGIKLMSSPKTARKGNLLSALAMLLAVISIMYYNKILTIPLLWVGIAVGGIIGCILALRVKMIQMPQMVALLNGLGGGASALVAIVEISNNLNHMAVFNKISGLLALIVGGVTLSGSLIAAGKLDRRIPQRPVSLPGDKAISTLIIVVLIVLTIIGAIYTNSIVLVVSILLALISLIYGVIFAMRVGGGDMPITISLLNSFSGLAASISGLTIGDPLLVSVGAIVGASGLILTQIMCKAMNRSLLDVLNGSARSKKTIAKGTGTTVHKVKDIEEKTNNEISKPQKEKSVEDIIDEAKKVIIIPGYGMAVAQAQNQVKTLFDLLESKGKEVSFAIHPVAGRMPGHMNVLLAEVDIPYDRLKEMDEVNEEFKETDVSIIIGASDVVNPAANTAEGTPIYGMPVLKAEESKNVIVFNLDDKPGYSGVENALYTMEHVHLIMGNASATVNELNMKVANYNKEEKPAEVSSREKSVEDIIDEAKKVIIIPGYGMAVAQAQNQVKTLFDLLESKGKEVSFAIHPVAGRMPGHMNVLLAEVDIPYDRLKEMDEVNEEFKETDVSIIIGASDVVNPAANTAEGTPIYGMPVLKAEESKNVIVFNLDDKPGYSGVENALYTMEHVYLITGNASETVNELNLKISK
ncbi:NAD(P)(+) transhydrogenase (Re/Si-specific) subunit beta [Proteiniborus sp. MB09-C3]|uniref:NAD(P)(+) transhydrogenase (Re/Si-specific) subunit beta n=1 Tax=Proteiniborus sp. MB09-C3 TaxID=3050072 RepID=UPI002554D85E|nr:NAD(P)(+) transhydrogenase (Re/Si-specific) subunit beta [Proteiniborus sp. MB09-C3]WIV11040.1 NAD(P)(+) transhydrogenase (Re/Si-specific) subunit beta [Proteiniborus sp. MB09-C3]